MVGDGSEQWCETFEGSLFWQRPQRHLHIFDVASLGQKEVRATAGRSQILFQGSSCNGGCRRAQEFSLDTIRHAYIDGASFLQTEGSVAGYPGPPSLPGHGDHGARNTSLCLQGGKWVDFVEHQGEIFMRDAIRLLTVRMPCPAWLDVVN